MTYKDQWVCVMDVPGNKNARPICIPQDVEPGSDGISLAAMQQILIDARLDLFNYFRILAIVKGEQKEHES